MKTFLGKSNGHFSCYRCAALSIQASSSMVSTGVIGNDRGLDVAFNHPAFIGITLIVLITIMNAASAYCHISNGEIAA